MQNLSHHSSIAPQRLWGLSSTQQQQQQGSACHHGGKTQEQRILHREVLLLQRLMAASQNCDTSDTKGESWNMGGGMLAHRTCAQG